MLVRTLLLWFSLVPGLYLRAAQQSDTLTIHFDRGSARISAQTDSLLRHRVAMWRRATEAGVIQTSPTLPGATAPLLHSSCSPEGPIVLNNRLAQKRAQAVLQLLGTAAGGFVVSASAQPDWLLLLQRMRADRNLPARTEAMQLVEALTGHNPTAEEATAGIGRLQRLAGGQTWQHLEQHHFPAMRRCLVVLPVAYTEQNPAPSGIDTLLARRPALPETLPGPAPMALRAPKKPFYMALKTNLLFDAILLPNIGIELAMGRRWSVAGNWAYNWLHTDARHYYWRIYGGDLELRRWLGDRDATKPLTGHHVGLYAGIVTYDIEFGGRGYLGNRWSYFGGVSYGYSMPIGRRLNLDFTAGLGYLGGRFKEYIPDEECYVWQATKNRHYIGPTKLEVSLVWLIGRGNRNSRKGGAL